MDWAWYWLTFFVWYWLMVGVWYLRGVILVGVQFELGFGIIWGVLLVGVSYWFGNDIADCYSLKQLLI